MIRGRQIADCDLARRLAVQTLSAERVAIDTATARPDTRPRWRPW